MLIDFNLLRQTIKMYLSPKSFEFTVRITNNSRNTIHPQDYTKNTQKQTRKL